MFGRLTNSKKKAKEKSLQEKTRTGNNNAHGFLQYMAPDSPRPEKVVIADYTTPPNSPHGSRILLDKSLEIQRRERELELHLLQDNTLRQQKRTPPPLARSLPVERRGSAPLNSPHPIPVLKSGKSTSSSSLAGSLDSTRRTFIRKGSLNSTSIPEHGFHSETSSVNSPPETPRSNTNPNPSPLQPGRTPNLIMLDKRHNNLSTILEQTQLNNTPKRTTIDELFRLGELNFDDANSEKGVYESKPLTPLQPTRQRSQSHLQKPHQYPPPIMRSQVDNNLDGLEKELSKIKLSTGLIRESVRLLEETRRIACGSPNPMQMIRRGRYSDKVSHNTTSKISTNNHPDDHFISRTFVKENRRDTKTPVRPVTPLRPQTPSGTRSRLPDFRMSASCKTFSLSISSNSAFSTM